MTVRTEDGRLLGDRVRRADSFAVRLRGRMGAPPLAPGEGLWLEPCAAVHTGFCRGAMDLVFLDAAGRVLAVAPAVPPWRLRAVRGARAVLELAAGAAAGLRPGQRLTVAGAGAAPASAPRVT